jgi:hypothetical protein
VIGLIGAVETGVGLWYFTSGHSINGMFYVIAFAVLISVYIRRERKEDDPFAVELGGGLLIDHTVRR